jgi:hypothetical protein
MLQLELQNFGLMDAQNTQKHSPNVAGYYDSRAFFHVKKNY